MSGIALLVMVFCGACQAELPEITPVGTISKPATPVLESPQVEPVEQITELPLRIPEPMKKTPERVPTTEQRPPVTGEAPVEILEAVLQDLSKRLSVSSQQITVVQAMAVVWNDGALGCPKPGMMYTQVLVNGYWIILEVDGKKYDYRATDKGYFFLCENAPSQVIPPGMPDS